MIRAVIFDCFGVIITDALQAICDELNSRDPAACEQVKDLIKANNRGLILPEDSNEQIAGILGISVQEFRRRIDSGEAKDERLLDYIVGLRGTHKTAMLSNIAGNSLEHRFTADELERCFDTVVISGDIGFAKPEPQAYEITADRLGVRYDECVFTDDRDSFCEAARAVGMQAIHYTSFDRFKSELEQILAAES
jgi:FMN phosphatase YigB (HAD superfamily)